MSIRSSLMVGWFFIVSQAFGFTYGDPTASYNQFPQNFSFDPYSQQHSVPSYSGYGQQYPMYAGNCSGQGQRPCGQASQRRRSRRHRHAGGQGCGGSMMSANGGQNGYAGHGGFSMGINFGGGGAQFY